MAFPSSTTPVPITITPSMAFPPPPQYTLNITVDIDTFSQSPSSSSSSMSVVWIMLIIIFIVLSFVALTFLIYFRGVIPRSPGYYQRPSAPAFAPAPVPGVPAPSSSSNGPVPEPRAPPPSPHLTNGHVLHPEPPTPAPSRSSSYIRYPTTTAILDSEFEEVDLGSRGAAGSRERRPPTHLVNGNPPPANDYEFDHWGRRFRTGTGRRYQGEAAGEESVYPDRDNRHSDPYGEYDSHEEFADNSDKDGCDRDGDDDRKHATGTTRRRKSDEIHTRRICRKRANRLLGNPIRARRRMRRSVNRDVLAADADEGVKGKRWSRGCRIEVNLNVI